MVKGQKLAESCNYENISQKIYDNLDFKALAERREDAPLLNMPGNLFKTEKNKIDLLLTRKYDKDNEAFYVYGAISCAYNLLDIDDPMNLIYKQKNNITAYLIYRLVNELNMPVQPKKFVTNFNRIKEWYRSCARLRPNSEWPIYGLVNNGTVINLHPPYIAEYVGGAYDFNIPIDDKENLLKIEVSNAVKIMKSLAKFSDELFFKFGLMDDIKHIPSLEASLLKEYIPAKERLSDELKNVNNFKKYLKSGVVENELELIFARPLSIIGFNKRLNEILDIIRNPDEFYKKCEESLKALEEFGEYARIKKIKETEKSEEEIKVLAKYGL